MTVVHLPAAQASTAIERSSTIDAVRAVSLLVVVVLHALMVGAWTGPDGGLLTRVALSGETWFAPVTWVLQVMPLFFIAGGFAALLQWRRLRGRGASAGEYVSGRVRRLAVPAVAMVATVGAVLAVARALGADASLLAEAGLRIGQPLWFLAVYSGVTALVPAMAWLHDRRPVLTLAGLAVGALAVDVTSRLTGLDIGYVNLVFVWLLMQQLGFVMLDGPMGAWPRGRLLAGVGISLALLVLCVGLGWSPDMIENLNPPTFALVLLGAAQFFALQLLRPWLDRVTARPAAARIAARVGGGAMSVYLWHMPLIMALVAGMWVLGLPLPEPHSEGWWISRLPWLAVIFAAVVPFAARIARIDRPIAQRSRQIASRLGLARIPLGLRAPLAVLLTISGTVIALLIGVDAPLPALIAAGLLGAAAIVSSAALSSIPVPSAPARRGDRPAR